MKFKESSDPFVYVGWQQVKRQIEGATFGKMPVELEGIDEPFAKHIIETAETGQQKVRDALIGLINEAEINATIDRLQSLAKLLKPLIGKEEQDLVITESKK